jgi:hypothetical protein
MGGAEPAVAPGTNETKVVPKYFRRHSAELCQKSCKCTGGRKSVVPRGDWQSTWPSVVLAATLRPLNRHANCQQLCGYDGDTYLPL